MSIELRDYQTDAVASIKAAFDGGSGSCRVMYQLPTGAGKTEIGISVIETHLETYPHARVVWLTHRQELREQSLDRMVGAGLQVVDLAALTPKRRALVEAGVSIMSPGLTAVQRQVGSTTETDLLVIDEAHHSVANSWDHKFVRPWPGLVLGLTGTPWRMSKKEGFEHLYQKLLVGPQIGELIDQGFLCDFTLYSPAGVVIKGAGRDASGDFSVSATEEANRSVFYSDLPVQTWEDRAGQSQRTIWYAPTVASAQALTTTLLKRGYYAALVHSKTPQDERKQVIADFSKGAVRHLVNVAIATEGFDCPDADCVVILRPTKSLALYRQMIGRALRPGEGKHAIILDLGRSWADEDVGHPKDDYEWSLVPRGALVDGEAPERWCHECEIVNAAAARSCHHCGAPFGQDCLGCNRFRFHKHWEDPENDQVCKPCRTGKLVDFVVTKEALGGDWVPNSKNTVLWHRSGNCLVMRSKDDYTSWLVGYRPDRDEYDMRWRSGYPTIQEALEATKPYVRSGFVELPTPPPPEPPAEWEYDQSRKTWRHGSGLCSIGMMHATWPQAMAYTLGYLPRDPQPGTIRTAELEGYSSLSTAKEAAVRYVEDTSISHPPPESDDHARSPRWRLSIAGYRVTKNTYGPGWVFQYPVNTRSSKGTITVDGFADEDQALIQAQVHLGLRAKLTSERAPAPAVERLLRQSNLRLLEQAAANGGAKALERAGREMERKMRSKRRIEAVRAEVARLKGELVAGADRAPDA